MDFKSFFFLCIGCLNYLLLSISVFIFFIFLILFSNNFRKKPKVKSYSQYMFFLFFFIFGSIGYLWQDAIEAALNKSDEIPFPIILNLLLYALVCGSTGAIIGYIIYWLSLRVNSLHQIRFINISLLFYLFLLSSIIIIKPFYERMRLFDNQTKKIKISGVVRNEMGLIKDKLIESQEINLSSFKECIAFEIRDTLDVFSDGVNTITIRQTAGSQFYTHTLSTDNISDVKASILKSKKGAKYTVILALMRPISGLSSLLIFNKYGQCLYEELLNDFEFGMAKNNKNEIILTKQEIISDSVIYTPKWRVRL